MKTPEEIEKRARALVAQSKLWNDNYGNTDEQCIGLVVALCIEIRDAERAKLDVAIEALKYIAIGTNHNPPLDSVELMSELANERLFDLSKARAALKAMGEGDEK